MEEKLDIIIEALTESSSKTPGTTQELKQKQPRKKKPPTIRELALELEADRKVHDRLKAERLFAPEIAELQKLRDKLKSQKNN